MYRPFSNLRESILSVAILLLTLTILSPGLRGGFFFDDEPNITENTAIRITSLNLESLQQSLLGPSAGPLGRPVSVLSFALTHYFFGFDAYAFKAINLGIHLINGLLVAWLVGLLLRTLSTETLSVGSSRWLPIWVAAAWLIHPINTVPVLLAVQRMTLLATMFMLLAMIAYLTAQRLPAADRRRGLLAILCWLVFWPLAILSKETGLLLPLFIALIGIMSAGQLHSIKKYLGFSAALVAALAVSSFWWLGQDWLQQLYAMRDFTLTERLMTEARVLWFYAAQILTPNPQAFGLYHDDVALSLDWKTPLTTLPAILGWIAIAIAIIRYRRMHPVLCFSAAWFLIGHSLESSFLPLEIAHEYRNYLPSLGLIFGIGYFCATRLQSIKMDHQFITVPLAALVPLLVLALFTWMRADQLSRPLSGLQIEAAHHPLSARANYSAGVAMIKAGYGDIGDPIGALSIRYYLTQSTRVNPEFKLGHLGLIVWTCASGRPVDQRWTIDLVHRLRHGTFSPVDRELPDRLLKPLLGMPQCLGRADAVELLTAATHNPKADATLRSEFLESAANYELLVSHDPVSARDLLAKAVRLAPHRDALKKKFEALQMDAS